MTTLQHDQIAKRSYMIWEQAGKPAGQDLDHWLRAEQELTALFNPPARNPLADEARPKKHAAAPKKAAAAGKAVKKADEPKAAKTPRSRAKTARS